MARCKGPTDDGRLFPGRIESAHVFLLLDDWGRWSADITHRHEGHDYGTCVMDSYDALTTRELLDVLEAELT